MPPILPNTSRFFPNFLSFFQSSSSISTSKHLKFGRVVLEAMAANVPVVAAWSGGVPEILGADMREFGHEPGNVEELAEKVIRLLGDPALRNTFAAKAKARVERFAIEDVRRKIEVAWEQAVKKN